MSAQPQRPITIEEYLDFEETSLEKHEFFRGEIFLFEGTPE